MERISQPGREKPQKIGEDKERIPKNKHIYFIEYVDLQGVCTHSSKTGSRQKNALEIRNFVITN